MKAWKSVALVELALIVATVVMALSVVSVIAIPASGSAPPSQAQFMDAETKSMRGVALTLVPVLPSRFEGRNVEMDLYPALIDETDDMLDWFNSATEVDGDVPIIAHVNGLPPRYLTQEWSSGDDEERRRQGDTGLHDCSNLALLAESIAHQRPANDVIVVLAHHSWSCYYKGLASFRGKWIVVTGWEPQAGTFSAATLKHEFGHTLGLPHARKANCNIYVGDWEGVREHARNVARCEHSEYGDIADPMGRTLDIMTPGFNALNREKLRVGGGRASLSAPGLHQVTLPPVTAAGPDMLELPGGWFVSYRAPSGVPGDVDRSLQQDPIIGDLAGIYVHRLESRPDDAVPFPVLFPFKDKQPAGQEGDHFLSYDQRVSFYIDSITPGEGAHLTVAIAEPGARVVDTWSPDLDLVAVEHHERYSYLLFRAADP